jgi:pilus assembly protein FimV
MQLRTLALLCSIVGFLYSGFASALGLGEITLRSQYNQPLNAEIRLLKVRDLSEEEILAALGSRDDFKRAGVDRIFFLTGLNFEVVLDNPSRPYVRVTTRKPVTEPYLNFLLEVQWPSGRLLREYTILLDLPVFSQAAPSNTTVTAPSSAPSTDPSQPAIASLRSQASSSRPLGSGPASVNNNSAPTNNSQFSRSSVDNYRVRSGDTLWEIAESVRPDSSVSVNQTMIALQQANPEAFIGGNINRLKNGQVLRVPSANEITDISYNQAVRAVRNQNQSWSSKGNTKAVLTSAAPIIQTPSNSFQAEGRLTLGAADSGQGDVRGAGASGSGDSLKNELAIAKDELGRSNRENGELKSRLSELEVQIETMESLVKVTNDQLKALQLAAQNNDVPLPVGSGDLNAETPDASTDQLAGDITDPLGFSGDSLVSGAGGVDVASEAPVVVEQPIVEPTPELVVVTPPIAPPVIAPAEEKSGLGLLGIIERNLLAVGGGLLALLIGALILLKLRVKPEEADDGKFDLEENDGLFDTDELVNDEPVEEPEAVAEEDEYIEAQTEDVVAEADIYVSLGQENKAIELLQKEIQQNPDNADARLGLLRIYVKAQNAVAFDEQYAQLLPLGNVYANDQAMALRKDISNVEPFDTDQYSAEAESDDAFDSLGLGDDLENDLDLDLSLDLDADLNVDLDDLSIELDDIDDTPGELSLDSDDGSLSFDDLDFDDNEDGFSLVDEMADDLDKLDVEDIDLDDLDLDIDSEIVSSLDSLDDVLSIDDSDTVAADMEFDLDFESADAALGDELDLDAPPSEDLDLASLEEEIDAMTADLGESLPLDREGDQPKGEDNSELILDDPFDSSELDLDYELDLDGGLDLDSDLELDLDDELDLDGGLDLESDDDIDILASNELDELTASDEDELSEISIDNLDVEDIKVSSIMDDAVISEDEELEFLEASDEASAKLDLAKAYLDMGDREGAEDILREVIKEGNAEQKSEAEGLERGLNLESDDDIDILASGELDKLTVSGEDELSNIAIDVPDVEDIKVPSTMDGAAISEDEGLDFLDASDEVSTKLDLAKAYVDMGDHDGAQAIINEVIEEGNAEQKLEAKELENVLGSGNDLDLESGDDEIDLLASSELDELRVLDEDELSEITIDDLGIEDIKVSSTMDDAAISEDLELDFLEASDEVSTKLDLAKAYVDMGDREGAEVIINEVIEEGNAEQKLEAEKLESDLCSGNDLGLDNDLGLENDLDSGNDLGLEDDLDLGLDNDLDSDNDLDLESDGDEIDLMASSELDELTASDEDELSEITIDDLDAEDIKVSSMMDDAAISEDEELDFLEASDEVSTKLDLAKAYVDMGDREGAEDILNEVIEEGDAEQKSEAEALMRTI